MYRRQKTQPAIITIEEFERRQGGGPPADEPHFLSRWLRRRARRVLEARMENHRRHVPDLIDLFNHRAEGQYLAGLFDKIVNGVGREADRAALYVLTRYKLGWAVGTVMAGE